jgi:hypothetical protein
LIGSCGSILLFCSLPFSSKFKLQNAATQATYLLPCRKRKKKIFNLYNFCQHAVMTLKMGFFFWQSLTKIPIWLDIYTKSVYLPTISLSPFHSQKAQDETREPFHQDPNTQRSLTYRPLGERPTENSCSVEIGWIPRKKEKKRDPLSIHSSLVTKRPASFFFIFYFVRSLSLSLA